MACLKRSRPLPCLSLPSVLFLRSRSAWLNSVLGLLMLVLLNGQVASASSMMKVARGVMLSSEVLHTAAGPEQVTLLAIDLSSSSVRLGVVEAYDRLISPDETMTSMANRSGALAGINGDYFEINGPGRPIGMLAINGQLLQSPTYYAVMGVTSSGGLTIGPESFSGSVAVGNARHELSSVNIYNDAHQGKLVLITPDLGAAISVKGESVAILEATGKRFRVHAVRSNMTSLPVLAGQYALVGGGEGGQWLTGNLHVGDTVHVNEQVSPDDGLAHAIGGGPVLLKNGVLYNDPYPPNPREVNARNPLTAIGVSKDGMHALLVVFDGRLAGAVKSRGLTYADAARYMQAHGCYDAMLFDTGGSSEMVARLPGHRAVSVINAPSGGSERRVANGLFVFSK